MKPYILAQPITLNGEKHKAGATVLLPAALGRRYEKAKIAKPDRRAEREAEKAEALGVPADAALVAAVEDAPAKSPAKKPAR